MKNFKFYLFIGVVSLLSLLAACGGGADEEEASSGGTGEGTESSSAENNEAEFNLQIGHIAPDEHSFTVGIEEFVKKVEERTDGRVSFEVFGNGQLGGERDLIEQVQLGSLDMTVVTAGPLGNFVPETTVLEMPFLFRDVEHAYQVLDGEVGQELMGRIDEQGFKSIGWWENGMRHSTNNERPIQSPEDMEGLKMRTLENDIYTETYRSLGTDPTPIAFPEVYTSLQQGVVDGLDASYGVFYTTNLYEVQKHFSETGIYYAAAAALMNADAFASLPEDIQEVIMETGQEVAAFQRQVNLDMEEEQKADIKERGVEVVEAEEIDREAFQEAVQPVYDAYDEEFGEMIKRIQEVE
ncbi:TRAP transporter substrate-binding protein DctP [Alteribacillus iranensis]|uniref:Tripartite ATP-independent transporter solute receptor, DctP family n=1 Tax=Alteribacillus iranensis TaxID=930128 RepID=A0A1I2CNT0_9BACI|nr:TRAP transporter substrate-binding protein DctP [Alteribacillus iranensis]SFE69956.1 tripartite ATP-independent transporter solute receptor, DctP family [Alteribacillus iranensis]